jgi:rifampicin phosphotransferase
MLDGADATVVHDEPTLVGAGDATERLHSGQLVTVDGTMGVVTIHTAPSGPPN